LKKKSILLTIPTVTSYHTFLRELVHSLVGAGWDTHLACSVKAIDGLDCYREEVMGKVHNIAFPRGANPFEHLRAAGELRRLVSRLSPDLVHCHFGVTAFTGALARQAGWPPVIATIQGLTFPASRGIRKAVFMVCECWCQRSLQGTWVLSECDREALSRFGDKKRIHVQSSKGFGCRIESFAPECFNSAKLREIRTRVGISADQFVFIFIGRQVHFKGFAVVARAFMKLVPERENAVLLLVGDRDPLHSSGLSTEEETALKTHPNVRSVGWVSNVAEYLALANVNVFPSEREGMPVNLMESLAMGVPVITSNSRGCRHVVEHEQTGLIVSGVSPETFYPAMKRLMDDTMLRERLAANALARRSSFDRRTWIKEQMEIYEAVLEEHCDSNQRAPETKERRSGST
jgi:glycosyltransferase involved in cell wall biosynthesis